MFAPLAGTWEYPATGSANAALAALLLSLGGEERLILHFGMAVWDRLFGHGADISIEEDLLQAGHKYISMSELRMALETRRPSRVDRANAAAEASGCFGVPWFIVDGEAFSARTGWS